MGSSELRRNLAAAGRARLEQEFSLDSTVHSWARIYRLATRTE
jgi:hypothetical protein